MSCCHSHWSQSQAHLASLLVYLCRDIYMYHAQNQTNYKRKIIIEYRSKRVNNKWSSTYVHVLKTDSSSPISTSEPVVMKGPPSPQRWCPPLSIDLSPESNRRDFCSVLALAWWGFPYSSSMSWSVCITAGSSAGSFSWVLKSSGISAKLLSKNSRLDVGWEGTVNEIVVRRVSDKWAPEFVQHDWKKAWGGLLSD